MRNTLPLCAIGFSLSLASPAASVSPEAFNRNDWEIVVPSNPYIAAAMKKTCGDGTLAAERTAIENGSTGTLPGNRKINLYCVRPTAVGRATVSPVVGLELTVSHGLFGRDKKFILNRGHAHGAATLREPKGTELTFVSSKTGPASPAAKPSTPKTAAAPKTKAPEAKPPRAANQRHGKKHAAEAEPPLSYFEKFWLTPAELKNYNGAIGKKKPKPSAADLARAHEKARAAIEKNLPPGSRAGYQKLVDERQFGKKIDEFLSKLKKPGTPKTRFTEDELKQLTKKERAAYDAQPNDEARARFIAAHQADVDSRKAMKAPADRAAFDRLNDAQKEKFCEPFLLAGGSAAPVASEKSAKAQLIKTSAGESQAKGQIDGNTAKGDVVGVPKPTSQQSVAAAWQREACADFVAHKAQVGLPGRLGPLAVEDKAPGENPPEEKKDKHFYGNLANGMSFGIAGLVLGAFFGGPLVMAAFAIAAGVGAYYMSKHINSPEEDKKGPAPKASESKSPWSWLGF